jgi:hypothetical protein
MSTWARLLKLHGFEREDYAAKCGVARNRRSVQIRIRTYPINLRRESERREEQILMRTNEVHDDGDAIDANFDELLEKRTNCHIRRGKVTKRRKGPKNANAGSPGGIRQRRNKRWAW